MRSHYLQSGMGLLDRLFKKSFDRAGKDSADFFGLMAAPDKYAGNRSEAYRGWVFACVNAIAEEAAATELRLEEFSGEKWELSKNQDPIRVIRRANPRMSGYDLLFSVAAYLLIEGNSYWFVAYNRLNKPAELWPLDPTKVKAVIKDGIIMGYEVYTNGGKKTLSVNEIVPFRRFNPKDSLRGIGTVEAARLAIDTDENSASWNNDYFYNSAEPSAALETEQQLTEEQVTNLRIQWEKNYKGEKNAHKMAILHSGLAYKPTQLSHNDMQFLEQRRFSRDEIFALFRVPKTVLGIVEDVNRANAEASDYVFAKRVIKPMLAQIADKINEFYLPIFGLDPEKFRITFKDPVPQNEELTIKKYESGLQNGYMTINEVRSDKGLPPVTGGDVPYISLSQVPLSYSAEANQNDPNPQKTFKSIIMEKAHQRRVRFVTNEITKAQPKYKKLLLSRKGEIVRALKDGKKSLKKDMASDIVNVLFANIANTWLTEIEGENKQLYRRVITEAGVRALVQVGVNAEFNLKHPRATEWMEENGLRHATSIIDTLKREVRLRLVDGLDEGLSTFEIAEKISEFFDAEADYRAMRIARTEVVGAYAEGSLEGYRQSGVVKMKAWMTVGDDRVEDECQANEDQGPIGLEASFASGQSAPPVHPNCRCTMVPVMDDKSFNTAKDTNKFLLGVLSGLKAKSV